MANFNTVAGCFLASALFALVVGKVSNAVVSPHHLDKPALAVSDDAPAAEGAGGAAPAALPPIGPLLAGANVDNGKALFQKLCFTCHTIDKGGANKVGPNQWNLVGRNKGTEAGFSYSSGLAAMKDSKWTYEDIDHMIFKPTSFVKGTKMAFVGVPKEQDRADLIAYLRTMNDSPPPLPAAGAAPAAGGDAKPAGDKPAAPAPEKK